MVTHDNRILDIADRIVEMEDGYLTSNANLAAASGWGFDRSEPTSPHVAGCLLAGQS